MAGREQLKEFKDFTKYISAFDRNVVREIDPDEFIAFGLKDSHVYRDLFMKLTATMSAQHRTWVVALATAVKNRERILDEINTRFTDKEWYNTIRQFYENKTVTKNADKRGGGGAGRHPGRGHPVLRAARNGSHLEADAEGGEQDLRQLRGQPVGGPVARQPGGVGGPEEVGEALLGRQGHSRWQELRPGVQGGLLEDEVRRQVPADQHQLRAGQPDQRERLL